MSMLNQLSSVASGAMERARNAGLPVEEAQRLFDERIQPQIVKTMATRAIPFVRRTGVDILELKSGRVICEMPLKGNVNHIGTMYAGALFTLAEFPGGPLMLATFGLTRFIPIVTALDMEFIKAAKTDVRIELTLPAAEAAHIESETLLKGKAEFKLEGELKNAHGEIVARSHALYQMRERRK